MPNLFSPGGDLPIDRLAFGAMRLPQNDRKGFARDAETGRPERPILRVSNGPERTDGSSTERRVGARLSSGLRVATARLWTSARSARPVFLCSAALGMIIRICRIARAKPGAICQRRPGPFDRSIGGHITRRRPPERSCLTGSIGRQQVTRQMASR
jgi:hypothetical protein